MRMNNKSKLIIALFLMLLVVTSAAIANSDNNRLSDEIVQVPKLGVTFKKPNMWVTPDLTAMVANINKLDDDKENISKIIATHKGSIPVATFSKYDPSTYPGIIPTINVLIRANPYKDFPTFFRFIEMSSRSFVNVLNNCTITKKVTESTISGEKVVFFIAEFDINTAEETTHHVKNITYSIPFDNAFIQVSMSEETSSNNLDLFSDFMNSFIIKQK